MGHEARDLLHRLAIVLVDVDDDVGGFERTNAIELRSLGASHPCDARHPLLGMHAEGGAPDYALRPAESAEQLGDARYEGYDTGFLTGRSMRHADRVHSGEASVRCFHFAIATKRRVADHRKVTQPRGNSSRCRVLASRLTRQGSPGSRMVSAVLPHIAGARSGP